MPAKAAVAFAGETIRRIVSWPASFSAFIATAFAQPDHATARARSRLVADQMRPELPKLATLME